MIEPREEIIALQGYSPPIEGRRGMNRYDFNENLLNFSSLVEKGLEELNLDILSIYPEYSKYYEIFGNYYNIDASQILFSNGSDDAIKLIMETYMDRGDEIIIPEPTFSMYEFYARFLGLDIKSIGYNKDLTFPFSSVMQAISPSTRMIILVNPNNPTGSTIEKEKIISIINKAKTAIIIIDEAYYELYGETFLHEALEFENCIVIRTYSKAMGLAGLRIGVIMAKQSIIRVLKKSKSPYSVSSISLYLASKVIEDDKFLSEYVSTIKKNRAILSEEISNRGFKVYPSDANFILVNFGRICQWIIRFFKQQGVLIRDKSDCLSNCARITIGSKKDCNKVINTLDKALTKIPLIFDIDGVLVDVKESYYEAIKATVKYFSGITPNDNAISKLKNEGEYNNDWDLTQRLLKDLNIKIGKDRIVQKFQEYYKGSDEKSGLILNETWLPNKGLINELSQDHPMFIFTGRPREEAEFVLKRYNSFELFDAMITLDDTKQGKTKPNPWGLKQLLRLFKSDCAYFFGDTIDDMIAAKKAGIKGVRVGNHDNLSLVNYSDSNFEQFKIENINDIWEVIS